MPDRADELAAQLRDRLSNLAVQRQYDAWRLVMSEDDLAEVIRQAQQEACEAEREACARAAESLQDNPIGISDPSLAEWDLAHIIASAIRART